MIDLQALQRVTHAAPARLPERPRHNLPAELTGFVGRRKELAQLRSMLASSRLLSLTGAGGAGKTRLAVRLAYDVIDEFPDGVWLADLAPLTAPDLVALTLATAVGVREGPQRSIRDALLESLRHRKLLLVLDNCEHLIDACAELAETLLRGVPELRIVVTSREALGVPGETVARVPSLSLPEETASLRVEALVDAEGTRLFLERATAIDPAFRATEENAATIARICRRLDGMPLAIELAAARVGALPPERSTRGCRTDSACSPAARGRRWRGSGRSKRPWMELPAALGGRTPAALALVGVSSRVDARGRGEGLRR